MCKPTIAPPKFAIELITYIVDETHKEDIIGDIWEEYVQLRGNSAVHATVWFWIQFFSIVGYTLKDVIYKHHIRLCGVLIAVSHCLVFSMSINLLSWLLNTDYSMVDSNLPWSTLLFGHFHSLYYLPELWEFSSQRIGILSEHMFHSEALIWCLTVSAVGGYYYQSKHLSKPCFIAVGYILLFLPYIGSTLLLSYANLGIQQIGEILSLMLYTLIYACLPISTLSIMKLTKTA